MTGIFSLLTDVLTRIVVQLIRCRIMWKAFPCSTLSDVITMAEDYDVIGIDEGQFVSRWLLSA